MDFPILDTQVYGHPLVYLDNAATTQKPQQVVDALTNYYLTLNSNIHRGTHYLATRATERYEAVRLQVQQFIHAASNKEIVFTRGTTESINLVASSFCGGHLRPPVPPVGRRNHRFRHGTPLQYSPLAVGL